MHYIGIDLGGTSIKGAVVTEGGTILKEASCPTQRESGPEHVAREISGLITALAEGYDPQAIGGVGVGCPGIVEDHSGIVRYSANLHWENFDLRAAVQKYSGYTVRLANDANAAALGEVVAGCAQNVDSAVILTLGTGVGSGVVLNGKILTGCTGGAAELGHMVVEDGGALCACGRKGCFEAYASATGLIRMAKEAMAQHPESLLHATAAEVGEVNGRTIFQAKEQGDPTAAAVVDRYIHYLSVGIANINNWEADPYEGYETDDVIYGRGGSDQEGGMASAVYGAKIMKDLGLIPEGYKIMVVGSVQEEDCDGMCWQYIVNKVFNGPEDARSKIEFVISTEPTDGGIYRGHRGRMEIRVDVKGISCHGSAPERGDNAIYKMADILQNIRALNENGDGPSNEIKGLVKMLNPAFNPEHAEDAQFLGRGTCTVSQIFYTSPSRCAVADSCAISVDRRMTVGETWDSCLKEIEALPAVQKYKDDVKVSMYMYDRPSWTGEVYETECFFPTWINKESAAHVQALVDAHHALWGDKRIGHADADQKRDAMHLREGRPLTDKWTFSTNGVSIQGRYGIPCVGFGPGAESQAHAPNEITWKQDLVTCAALYAAVPGLYKPENKDGSATSFRQELTGNNIK